MTYSTAQINRDFRIKVYGYNNSDERLNLLVGVSGLIRLLGEEQPSAARFRGRRVRSLFPYYNKVITRA